MVGGLIERIDEEATQREDTAKQQQAERIIADGQADAVLLARELLRNPYWPRQAAQTLGAQTRWPDQYQRAAPTMQR